MPLSGRCLTPVWGDPTEEASDVVAEGLRARMSDLKRRLVPFPKSNSIEIDRAQGARDASEPSLERSRVTVGRAVFL